MKILWISNRIFDENEETQSGVWLKALAEKLAESENIILGNVSVKQVLRDLERCDFGKVIQWALPIPKINRKGYPDKQTAKLFEVVVEEFNPDIIQVWGSENPLKRLPFDKTLSGVKVLTMQGVLASMGPNNLRGMNLREIISTIGLREILSGRSILTSTISFFNDAKFENEMIKHCEHIITQSDWTNSQIQCINPGVNLYRTQRKLREKFIECKKWHEFPHLDPIIFTSALGYSWKGLHVLLKSLSIIKCVYPTVKLLIAGKHGRTDFLGEGYLRMMINNINRNHLNENVSFIGDLSASQIVGYLQKSSLFVHPSFVESYSNSLAEAMSVGTPAVVSFAGAMPELAENNKEALFFSPGDYKHCAFLIVKLLSDTELAKRISINAVRRAEERTIKTNIVKQQLDIYDAIMKHEAEKTTKIEPNI